MRALRVLQERGAATRARVAREVGAALGEGLVAAAARAHAALDEEHARALTRSSAPAPACAAGCAYCCHVHVDATGPELLAIAAHLARTRSHEAIAALVGELAAQARRVERLSDEERWAAKIPCALLGEGGLCSIYAARPLRCRAFHSGSVEPCRDAFAGGDAELPRIPHLERALAAAEAGYDEALRDAGLPAEVQRLELGLLAALTEARD